MKKALIVSPPLTPILELFLIRLIEVVESYNYSIDIITSGDINIDKQHCNKIIHYSYSKKNNIIHKMIRSLYINYDLCRIALKKDDYQKILFSSSQFFLLPILCYRIKNKSEIILIPGGSESLKYSQYNKLISIVYRWLEKASYLTCDTLVIFSKSLIDNWDLVRYTDKIKIANRHYKNEAVFFRRSDYNDRKYYYGYIGRLENDKGIINLIKAFQKVVQYDNRANIVIVGRGALRKYLIDYIDSHKLSNNVTYLTWVDHHMISNLLNEISLLIIPSFTEGLPNVFIESLFCGTPVLANSVGALRDHIVEGENGYLVDDNNITTLSEKLIELSITGIDRQISDNCIEYAKLNFSKEKVISDWNSILNH